MGKPAARLGDPTAHGGSIVIGCPTVLIGGMPAARIGDMHVCPMVNPGPVPHVGGPISLGSAGVFIGGMPAARVGDMAVCTGPPDTIAMGCPTVLIGEVASSQGATMGQARAMGAPFTKMKCDHEAKAGRGVAGEALGPEEPHAPGPDPPEADAPGLTDKARSVLAKLSAGVRAIFHGKRVEAKPAPPAGTTGLGAEVDGLVSKSPLFTNKVKGLSEKGWTFKYGEAGKGSYCQRGTKTIVIDSRKKDDPRAIAGTLAHEAGHAAYQPSYVGMKDLTREEYVTRNTTECLKDEGEATLTSLEVRDDLKKHGGGSIPISGSQRKKYEKIYKKHKKSEDRDEARGLIGDIFADKEHPSTRPASTYREYYASFYEEQWDKTHPPSGGTT